MFLDLICLHHYYVVDRAKPKRQPSMNGMTGSNPSPVNQVLGTIAGGRRLPRIHPS